MTRIKDLVLTGFLWQPNILNCLKILICVVGFVANFKLSFV